MAMNDLQYQDDLKKSKTNYSKCENVTFPKALLCGDYPYNDLL